MFKIKSGSNVFIADGGKLELWDIVSKETVCSVLAHDNAISALCVSIFGKWCKNALRIRSHSYLSESFASTMFNSNSDGLAWERI